MPDARLAGRMQKKHKEYQRLRPEYDFLRAAYMGGPAFLARNLFRHEPRETQSDYKRRLERAVYPNYVRPVIRTYRDHIFRHEDGIERPEGSPQYMEWLLNVDRRGSEANRFWGGILSRQLLYGWTAILVDSPKLRPEIKTLADQEALGELPYLVHVSPRQIVDWNLDEEGAFKWVRIEEKAARGTGPMEEPEDYLRWRIWTREEWMVVTEEGDIEAQGTHDLGRVPMVVSRFENPEEDDHSNELAGVGFMTDFARINRMIANKTSEVDSFLSKNMLQILTVSVSYMAQMGEDADQAMTLGDGSVLQFPQEGESPQFIAPDVSGATQAFEHIQMLRWELFRIATQKDIRAQAGVTGESGISKMVDFEEQNAVLSSLADGIQVAEQDATDLWMRWQGQETTKGEEIDYPDNYNLRSLMEDIEIAVQVQGLYGQTSPTFMTEYLVGMARKITDDVDEAQMSKIRQEIEENLANRVAEDSTLGRIARETMNAGPLDDAEEDDADAGDRV